MFKSSDLFHDPKWVRQYEYRVWELGISKFLQDQGFDWDGKRVLDLGCGSGGITSACAENGGICTGIDRSEARIAEANKVPLQKGRKPEFYVGNILMQIPINGSFDLILLNEIVEHLVTLENVQKILQTATHLLKDDKSRILVTFPPYRSPFGGHQAGWPVLTFLPWIHLFPSKIVRKIAPEEYIDLITNELNHLRISDFESIVANSGLFIEKKTLFLFRPEYKIRYNIPIVRYPQVFSNVLSPLAEYFTSGVYYLLRMG
jgi:2-polyprenyl-3-methyl-5-hydroxy-6-metoxy-1,4-benzoquinol methylase